MRLLIKSTVLILFVFLFLHSTISVSGMEYKECPEFQKLVLEQKLPPIKERLPEEPMVVNVQEIGNMVEYGDKHNSVSMISPIVTGLSVN